MDENSHRGWYNKTPFLIFQFFFLENSTALKIALHAFNALKPT